MKVNLTYDLGSGRFNLTTEGAPAGLSSKSVEVGREFYQKWNRIAEDYYAFQRALGGLWGSVDAEGKARGVS